MTQTYEYQGFTLVVTVENDSDRTRKSAVGDSAGFVATIRILREGVNVAIFSPLRVGDIGGQPFISKAAALAGGRNAAQKIVDDLFGQAPA